MSTNHSRRSPSIFHARVEARAQNSFVCNSIGSSRFSSSHSAARFHFSLRLIPSNHGAHSGNISLGVRLGRDGAMQQEAAACNRKPTQSLRTSRMHSNYGTADHLYCFIVIRVRFNFPFRMNFDVSRALHSNKWSDALRILFLLFRFRRRNCKRNVKFGWQATVKNLSLEYAPSRTKQKKWAARALARLARNREKTNAEQILMKQVIYKINTFQRSTVHLVFFFNYSCCSFGLRETACHMVAAGRGTCRRREYIWMICSRSYFHVSHGDAIEVVRRILNSWRDGFGGSFFCFPMPFGGRPWRARGNWTRFTILYFVSRFLDFSFVLVLLWTVSWRFSAFATAFDGTPLCIPTYAQRPHWLDEYFSFFFFLITFAFGRRRRRFILLLLLLFTYTNSNMLRVAVSVCVRSLQFI